MLLSYTSRMICLALCGAGIMLCAMEVVAWMVSPYLLRQGLSASARSAERTFFLVALFARVSPWLVVLGVWMPAYMRGEDNLAPERVGLTGLCTAACMICLLTFTTFKAIQTCIGTRRFRASCQELEVSFGGSPVLLHPGEQPLLAVIGVFRPRLIVSMPFVAPGIFSASTLDVAFRHEGAHVRQRDNLKRFVLSLLPHLPFGKAYQSSLDRLWRLAAEIAADEEGSMGSRDRSILLAELLVSVARRRRHPLLQGAFELLAGDDDLSIRVDRLLSARTADASGPRAQIATCSGKLFGYTLAMSFAVFAVLSLLGAEFGHPLAEALLHLG